MGRRPHGRHRAQENRDASVAISRGSVPGRTPRKKLSKVVEGELLSLDRSLLMGDFLYSALLQHSQLGVQGVAQGVAKEIEGKDTQADSQPREDGHPGCR